MEKIISVQGYEFKVDFDYNPLEQMTRHYPGCPEYVDINDVWDSDGDKIKEWAFDMLQNDIELACLEAIALDREEAKMAREEARMEAYEKRHRFDGYFGE